MTQSTHCGQHRNSCNSQAQQHANFCLQYAVVSMMQQIAYVWVHLQVLEAVLGLRAHVCVLAPAIATQTLHCQLPRLHSGIWNMQTGVGATKAGLGSVLQMEDCRQHVCFRAAVVPGSSRSTSPAWRVTALTRPPAS